MTNPHIIARLIDIRIGFPSTDDTFNTVVGPVSLTVRRGERVGLIGASGSGKSLTALSLLGLVPPPGAITAGSVEIQGVTMVPGSDSDSLKLRGGAIGLVFQEAESALNPVLTIGAHLEETIKRHRPAEEPVWRKIAFDLLKQVDLEPQRILKSHPHRLSGGQRQRALIAIALAGDPQLMIADEPTSSLDVLTQARILGLLGRLCRERDLALLLISHDLGVVSSLVDRVVVILSGAIVEMAPITEFLDTPLHPYSQSLVASARQENPLTAQSMDLPAPDRGCAFALQCPRRLPQCEQELPNLTVLGAGRELRCPIVAAEVNQ